MSKVKSISSSDQSASVFSSPERRTLVLCLLLAMLTLGLYNQVSHFQFINFDDDDYVTMNAHVQAGLTWDTVSWAARSTDAANWHPLTWLSHALDYQIFHLNPAGHHYVNLLFHASNVLLLFLLLQRGTGRTWESLTVAALFAVHPMNVESVAWVAERKNVLSMFFFLLTLGAYGRYVYKPVLKRYLLVVLLFALGLMAKPMVITLPFVLLLLDFWPFNRIDFGKSTLPRLFVEKIPLLALSAVSGVITLVVQRNGSAVKTLYPLATRIGNAIVSYVAYIGKAVWPSNLAAMYPHQGDLIAGWTIAASAIALLVGTVVAYKLRRCRYLPVGWLWFLGTLVPVIGLVQVGGQAMADRYAYLPLLGLFVAAVWGAADLARTMKISPAVLGVAVVVAVAALSTVTYKQEAYWHDSVALWTHTIAVTKPNFAAQDNLGVALVSEGRVDEATPHFQEAVQINPLDPIGQLNVGVFEQLHGKVRESTDRYRIVLQQTRDIRFRVFALENLGSAYRTLGDFQAARANYEAALQLSPSDTFALVGLGIAAQRSGDVSRAAEYFAGAVQIRPSDIGYLLLAQALEKSGRPEDARAATELAQKVSSNLDAAQQSLNRLLTE